MISELILLVTLLLFQRVEGIGTRPASPNAETSDEGETPLLFPILGHAYEMRINAWVYETQNPSHVSEIKAILSVDCPLDEIVRSNSRVGKSIVFGRRDYQKEVQHTPSALISLDDTEDLSSNSGAYQFCIKTLVNHDNFLSRLLSKFENKIISFWWDKYVPTYEQYVPEESIGELSIGGYNPTRFVANTEVNIEVEPSTLKSSIVPYWKPVDTIVVSVGKNPFDWEKDVVFNLSEDSKIPADVYDSITKRLREKMSYRDVDQAVVEFNCIGALMLSPLNVGPLVIQPYMMYKQITPQVCEMILSRSESSSDNKLIVIGGDLIRQFYFSVYFSDGYGDTLQFAIRKDGAPPDTPVSLKSQKAAKHPTLSWPKFLSSPSGRGKKKEH